jgi:hypothetical protein
MNLLRSLMSSAATAAVLGCGSVPSDPGPRIFPVKGVIRGSVLYQGPRPCSREGHIVGGAILLVFDRRNPPPPDGLAQSAANFAVVTGDALFQREPRFTGTGLYCPLQAGFRETITASAPFDVSPLDGGSYEIRAFFDYTGNFLPEFSIRNLPEQGDVAGGDFDTLDALQPVNVGNPDFGPLFLPIDVGIAQPLPAGSPASAVPDFVIPAEGFVADNVTVTLTAPLPSTRPYFYAQGEQVSFDPTAMRLTSTVTQSSERAATDSNGIGGATETDPTSMPILTLPQDISVLAPPLVLSPASAAFYEASFPHLLLPWGVPDGELSTATASPFELQVAPFGGSPGAGLLVWQNAIRDGTGAYAAQQIPEGSEPELWPKVILTKLPDPSASATAPVVLLEGITLLAGSGADSLLGTALAAGGGALFAAGGAAGPRPVVFAQDHLAVVLRPSVICLPSPPQPGTLVTPRLTAATADVDCSGGSCVASGMPDQPISPASALTSPALAALVAGPPQVGCLPTGRFAIHVVYRDGQAWTVPNEAGVCSPAELTGTGACTRPLLPSQGNRAVVEIVTAQDPSYCAAHPVPQACLASR